MSKPRATMAQQVAQAVMAFQQQTTGHAPRTVTVVLSQNTVVATLHEALSPAEKDMSKNLEGAARIQEYHRQLFATSSHLLGDEITRITGVEVREAVAEIEPVTVAAMAGRASPGAQRHGVSASSANDDGRE